MATVQVLKTCRVSFNYCTGTILWSYTVSTCLHVWIALSVLVLAALPCSGVGGVPRGVGN